MSLLGEIHARHKAFHANIARAANRINPPKIPPRLQMTPIERLHLTNPAPEPVRPRPLDALEERAWTVALCEPEAENPDKIFPTVAAIQRLVCKQYNTTREAMTGQSRKAHIIRPRFVAMYLCRQLTKLSLPQIGRAFGGRDHTTTMNALRKMRALLERDPALASEIAEIRSQFVERVR